MAVAWVSLDEKDGPGLGGSPLWMERAVLVQLNAGWEIWILLTDWSVLDWIVAVGVLAGVVSAVGALWSLYRKRQHGAKASLETTGKARTAQVVESPQATVVMDSPGATVVQGDMHLHGYTAEDHQRIIGERVAQTRADLERAHQAKVDALRAELAMLRGPEWDAESVRAVEGALSASDFERAEDLLAEMEERHLRSVSVPATQQRVRILNFRTAAAMLNGKAEKATAHVEAAAAAIASVSPGSELEFRNSSAKGMQEYGASVGGNGIVEAIRLYRVNLDRLDPEELPGPWSETQHNLGTALLQHGTRVEGGLSFIDEGIQTLRLSLEVCIREADVTNRIQTQISLSGALAEAGQRRGGEAGARDLAEAVSVCRDAEAVTTRDADPEGWAGIQNNLAVVLSRQGDWRGDGEGAEMLAEAAEVWLGLLEVRTRESDPLAWADIQSNLAATLGLRARLVPKQEAIDCLEDAVKASRAAFEIYTRCRNPLDWAKAHANLGANLKELGELLDGKTGLERVQEAIAALKSALERYDRSEFPLERTGVLQGLGAAFLLEAKLRSRTDGLDVLTKAIAVCQEGLDLLTRSGEPLAWAGLRHNLGAAFVYRGRWTGGSEGMAAADEAVAAFREELDVYERNTHPMHWAKAQFYLGVALELEGDLDSVHAREKYREGLVHVDAALEELFKEPTRWCVEDARKLRGRLIAELAEPSGGNPKPTIVAR